MPTAGEPHPGVRYQDTRLHWDSMRLLATTLLGKAEDASGNDALTQFGHMNLDTRARGKAEDVSVTLPFATWVLVSLRDILRPRVLVLLGLTTFLARSRNRPVRRLIESTFFGVQLARPQATYSVEALSGLNYVFREWDIKLPDGCDMKLVLWPQRIGRAPIGSSNLDRWRNVWEEFKARHEAILR